MRRKPWKSASNLNILDNILGAPPGNQIRGRGRQINTFSIRWSRNIHRLGNDSTASGQPRTQTESLMRTRGSKHRRREEQSKRSGST
nr:hypothetical protein Itr_chr14CG07430 [Ipomoea trifida]